MPNDKNVKLEAGLYLVATPIGAARDITLRSLDILRSADILAAEDTRSLRRLMEIHGIPLVQRDIISYHDHNGAQKRPGLLAALSEGKSVAYSSEAGTPLIADPGYDLVNHVRDAGFLVTAAPGASAVITALSISGLPTDRFCFLGFVPSTKAARRRVFNEVSGIPATLVFYESPKRLGKFLEDAQDVFGPSRKATICREMTKKFEEVIPGDLETLSKHFHDRTPKGELVILITRGVLPKVNESDLDDALREEMKHHKVKEAADNIAKRFGQSKREMYQRALSIRHNIL